MTYDELKAALTAFLTVLLFSSLLLFSAPLQLHAAAQEPPHSNLINSKSYEKKLEQARSSYELFPLNEGLKRNLAEGYAAYGHTLLKQKQYDQADQNLVKAIELYPDEPAYALVRGICTFYMKKYDVARYELERARSLQPEFVEALIYLGLVQYETDNRLEAVQSWEQALKLAPRRNDIVQLLEKARKEAAVESGMDRGNSSRFNLTYDPGVSATFALAVLDVLESASNQVGAELGHFPAARVPVVIYKRDDYTSVTNSPDWSGGVYDGTIRLPFGTQTEINANLRSVLFHEYTHVVIFDLTHGNCPVWLNEGIAEMFGRRQLDHSPPAHEHGASKTTIIEFRKLEGSFSGLSSQKAAMAYQQSYSMVNYLVTAYGWHRVNELLVNLGKGMNMDAAVALTLQDYSVTYNGLINEWRESQQRRRLNEN